MGKGQNITISIDLETRLDNAQKGLVNLQKSFEKLNLTDSM
jgi:hypothetical protein